jgi:uncharacterized protein YjbJ (UPF0337 family)
MNKDELQGRWTQMKGKIKERWGRLTDDELDRVEGQWDQLVGLIQRQYGLAREEADRQVQDLRRTYDVPVDTARASSADVGRSSADVDRETGSTRRPPPDDLESTSR